MAANFSGALKISDLNDFINPSQECVKPVVIERPDARVKAKPGTIEIEHDGSYSSVQNGKVEKLKKVEITLNDCLACSGCITTAETVLVSQQSKEELYKVLHHNTSADTYYKVEITLNDCLACSGCITTAETVLVSQQSKEELYKVLHHSASADTSAARKVVIISLSPPSLASLAAHYHIPVTQAASCLTHFFKSLGVEYVVDTNFANALSLVQSGVEFVERYRRREGDKTALPMLASQCPGWICYAEKTHGSYILPHLSRVKSPQQINGSLIKKHFASRINKFPSEVYHVTVMPCYDKKLEASRPDFYDKDYETRDVDCVLTTGEVLSMLEADNYSLETMTSETPLDNILSTSLAPHTLYCHAGGASGGYLEYITRYAAMELFGLKLESLDYNVLRNQDMQEVTIHHNDQPVLRMALAYGFRNIQIIVQKIKRGKCPYDYVEVMACPSGCNNGGGQITASEGESAKDRLTQVHLSYESMDTRQPMENPDVEQTFDSLGGCGSETCACLLETEYHYVPKTENLNIGW